jgi:hypothetical protein
MGMGFQGISRFSWDFMGFHGDSLLLKHGNSLLAKWSFLDAKTMDDKNGFRPSVIDLKNHQQLRSSSDVCWFINPSTRLYWLVVSTPLKNISQLG